MIRSFLALSSVLVSLVGFSFQAEACQGGRCSQYDWASDGTCREWTANGILIGWANTEDCRRECGVVRRRH